MTNRSSPRVSTARPGPDGQPKVSAEPQADRRPASGQPRLDNAPWLSPRQSIRAALVVLAAALLLRIQGLGWDGWLAFHPDERNLVAAAARLGLAQPIPDFYAYGGLAVWLPRLLGWIVDPACAAASCLLLPARLISALFGALAVALGALICRRLGGERAMLAGAALLGFSAPLIQWAHFGTTESALVCLILALWLISIRYLQGRDGPWRMAALSAILLGLGLGLKLVAASMALVPLGALALRWPGAMRALMLVAMGGIVTAALGLALNPALITDTGIVLATWAFEGRVVSGAEDVFWTWQFIDTAPRVFQARQLASMLGWGVAALALGGILWAVARGRTAAMPGLGFLILYGAIVFAWHAKFARYLAPILPILLIFAALASERMLSRMRNLTLRIAVAAAVAVPMATGLAMALSFQAQDPRIAASQRLAQHAVQGDTILAEVRDVGALGADRARVELLDAAEIEGAAPMALARRLAQADWLILTSRRHWSVLPRLGDRFPGACAFYAALAAGDLGYRVTDQFARAAPFGRLFDLGLSAEETRVVFDRPRVYLLQNLGRISAEAIVARLAARPDAAACTPRAIQAALDKPR